MAFFGEYPWATPFDYIYDKDNVWIDERKGIPCDLIPTTNDLNISFSFDGYQNESINPTLPSQTFFEDTNLRWNARDGYNTEKGETVFIDPSIHEAGPSTLLVRKDFLFDFLKRNDLSLLWTVLSEKQIIPGSLTHGPGYTSYSRAYLLNSVGNITSNRPFTKTVIHEDEEH